MVSEVDPRQRCGRCHHRGARDRDRKLDRPALGPEAEGTYRAILGYPFLDGLTDGSPDEGRFAYYIAQDTYYLRDYARVWYRNHAARPDG